ncbi:HNH endonuclease [Litoreibacter albidus]|uniref:HNH endonuclease n=1 Tax=Litoreibacter albidus TaxID=670155 RepID=UPI003735E15A
MNEFGAKPHNPRNAWSFVNHDKRIVLIAAWAHTQLSDKKHIFSRNWKRDTNNRKTASYKPTLRHLEHVLEDGYRLFAFTQYAKKGTEDGIPRISSFEQDAVECQIQILGGEYFAVPLAKGGISIGEIEPTDFIEGRAISVLQTHYERNPHARQKCLDHFGFSCAVCDFNFEEVFSKLGYGFIHVHHLVPVSKRKTSYKVNPISDLVPVCPNCHAMLHRKSPPYEVNELKEIMGNHA